MMTHCDEDIAKNVSRSLLNHAREIYRYAKTYCQDSAKDFLDENGRNKAVRHVDRMLKEMYALMLMARYRGVSRFCNKEQIEAYVDAAQAIVSPTDKLFPGYVLGN
ncbi:MAG: hypothetical protein LIQ31_08460 [Planctomycetes bacterium]|nr:hypothetical protein [Planctomycetota bacterium]